MAQIKRLNKFLQKYRLVSGFITETTETTTRDLRLSELPVSPLLNSSGGCKNDNKHCKMGEEWGGALSGVFNTLSNYPAVIQVHGSPLK